MCNLPHSCFVLLLAWGVLLEPSIAARDAASLKESALASIKRGQYAAAQSQAASAAELYRADNDPAGEADALNALGLALTYSAQYSDAEASLRRAVSLSRRTGSTEPLAEQLMNLGNVLFYQAQYSSAMASYHEALEAVRGRYDARSRRREALVNLNIAVLQQRVGNDRAALETYRGLLRTDSGLQQNEVAQALVNLGAAYRRLGDPYKALEQYRSARRIFAGDRHVDGELSALRNRGIVLALDLGDLRQSIASFTEGLSLASRYDARRQAVQFQLYRGEAYYRVGDLTRAQRDFEQALESARDLNTPEEEWKCLYGLGRIALRSGDTSRASHTLRAAVSAIEKVRERIGTATLKRDFFSDKRDVYDALIQIELRDGRTPNVFGWIERARARTFQDRIRPDQTAPSLEQVQDALPEGAVLLDYWQCRRGSAVLWATHSEAGVQSLGEAAAPHDLLPGAVRGARYVIIVPDGNLAGVAFETIPFDGALLIEKTSVSYMPAASVLLRPASRRGWRSWMPWFRQTEAFGDPLFAADIFGGPAQRLPWSEIEAREVANAFNGRAVLHTGQHNRKDAFISAASPVLHIASHAVADPVYPDRSRILFSSPPGERVPEYLFLAELYRVKMAGIEIATLSACETEKGVMIGGEGRETFSRALLASGARSAITTLWRVDDQVTRSFMRDLYSRLAKGVPRAEALRATKLHFLRSGGPTSDARYWAAFVLTGEPFEPVPQPLSWPVSLAVCATAAAALAVYVTRTMRHRGRQFENATTERHSRASLRKTIFAEICSALRFPMS